MSQHVQFNGDKLAKIMSNSIRITGLYLKKTKSLTYISVNWIKAWIPYRSKHNQKWFHHLPLCWAPKKSWTWNLLRSYYICCEFLHNIQKETQLMFHLQCWIYNYKKVIQEPDVIKLRILSERQPTLVGQSTIKPLKGKYNTVSKFNFKV